MACDVSPVAMFFIELALTASDKYKHLQRKKPCQQFGKELLEFNSTQLEPEFDKLVNTIRGCLTLIDGKLVNTFSLHCARERQCYSLIFEVALALNQTESEFRPAL